MTETGIREPKLASELHIVDTTLRDGEQSAGIALGVQDKLEIARILDHMGVCQIEAGIPAMGGSEKKSMEKIARLGLKSRISAWNRMNREDIAASMDCGDVLIHISIPSSDVHIRHKLNKDRGWVVDTMQQCICYAREQGYEVAIGLEDASRAELDFLVRLGTQAFAAGAARVRYADTVGILYRQKACIDLMRLRQAIPAELEIHTHNDLGMALANSLAAVDAGVRYIDTTIGGIGERAGNCNYLQFVSAAKAIGCGFQEARMEELASHSADIMKIMKRNSGE